jgi:hypothetical protein
MTALQLIARLRHGSLDRRLAAGEPSHSGRLLAARSTQLGSMPSRRRLAARWDELATHGRRTARGWTGEEAVEAVDTLAAVLSSDELMPVQGVALAAVMLSIAAAAVDRLDSGGDDLLAAAARATLAAMCRPLMDCYPASSLARAA